VVTDFLVNRGRGFIFSTAPSPLMAAVVRVALRIIRDRSDLREELWARVHYAAAALGALGASASGSQIIPFIIGRDDRTMALAETLQAAGFDVRGIRPPTVPRNTARLRISITRNASIADIDGLATALESARR
jgi:8-amino-7-oxononanoate synthase